MNIRDAIQLKNAEYTLTSGVKYSLKRPSALDLVEMLEFSKANQIKLPFYLLAKHLLDENGEKVFSSIQEAESADAEVANEIYLNIEKLYGEGRD